jgi:hypothetical protein
MSLVNPTWRAPRIHSELLLLGYDIVESTISKYLIKIPQPPSQNWKVFLNNITTNPTSQWTAQQIIEAFPYDQCPKYLIRDRDAIYGHIFQNKVKNMGINEVVTAPKSPWQNPYVERLIGSIRRECLDHVIIFNQKHLNIILTSYCDYYLNARTHLSLEKNSPNPRKIEPKSKGKVIALPQVGGLHHLYTRAA